MKLGILRRGSAGPQVELLQLGLQRAGFYPEQPDGLFGNRTSAAVRSFQTAYGLTPDGIAGPATWRALTPYLTGYTVTTIAPGDTFYRLASRFGTTIRAIETANPGLDVFHLPVGRRITIPLGFEIVPVNIRFTSTVLEYCTAGLVARYPFLKTGSVGTSVMGTDIPYLSMGNGFNQVLYNAAHHANEWVTSPLVMKFLENYAASYSLGRQIFGLDARTLFETTTLCLVPMVNPDGVNLVTGELAAGDYYEQAQAMSADYPSIPFPSGWKANIDGIDTNLQYPAGWEEARSIKFAEGYTRPGPRDFVGSAPLEAPESRGLYLFTQSHDFRLTLSYHTQGQVIYWKYLDRTPPNSYEIGRAFAEVSGYALEETPYGSGFAGYKDWFIAAYNLPGYTIEAGYGQSPLPLSQFPEIYRDNEGILALGLQATV